MRWLVAYDRELFFFVGWRLWNTGSRENAIRGIQLSICKCRKGPKIRSAKHKSTDTPGGNPASICASTPYLCFQSAQTLHATLVDDWSLRRPGRANALAERLRCCTCVYVVSTARYIPQFISYASSSPPLFASVKSFASQRFLLSLPYRPRIAPKPGL